MPKPERAHARAVRVTIEYEDGVIAEIEGAHAQEYIDIVDDQAMQAWNRGARLPPLPWRSWNKNCVTCTGTGKVSANDPAFPHRTMPCTCVKGPR